MKDLTNENKRVVVHLRAGGVDTDAPVVIKDWNTGPLNDIEIKTDYPYWEDPWAKKDKSKIVNGGTQREDPETGRVKWSGWTMDVDGNETHYDDLELDGNFDPANYVIPGHKPDPTTIHYYVDPSATGTGSGESWENAFTSLFEWEAATSDMGWWKKMWLRYSRKMKMGIRISLEALWYHKLWRLDCKNCRWKSTGMCPFEFETDDDTTLWSKCYRFEKKKKCCGNCMFGHEGDEEDQYIVCTLGGCNETKVSTHKCCYYVLENDDAGDE